MRVALIASTRLTVIFMPFTSFRFRDACAVTGMRHQAG
jgi:hypothetical protein